MKKTLVMLLALAGAATAAEPIWTSVDGIAPTSYALSGQSSFSVALSLNIATLQAESGANFNGSAKIVDLIGTWDTSSMAASLDINVNGSSNGKTSTLYAGGKPGVGNYASNYSLTGISSTTLFDRNTDWSLLEDASLVMVKNGGGANDAIYAYLTLQYTDGSIAVYEGGNTGIKFTIDHDGDDTTAKLVDNHINVSTINFTNNFALSAQVYDYAMTADEAKAIGAALIVPEPTTATLSLLALAGLAARRRRR